MNIAFQIEAITNSDGDREVVHIECDPTTERATETLEASEIDEGAWEFRFVLDEDCDGTEPVFAHFARRRLEPAAVHEACRDAAGAIAPS